MKWAVIRIDSGIYVDAIGQLHTRPVKFDRARAYEVARELAGARVVRILSHDEACRKRAAVALYELARDMDSGNGRDMWGEALVEEVKRRARELAPWVKR